MTLARRLRARDGSTLIEVLMAVTIMGIAFAVIVGGVATSILASDVHRKQATAETALRSFAEAVKAADYTACAATYSPSFTPPDGFTASVTGVEYWGSVSSFTASCTTDGGLQRVSLFARSSDGRAEETVQVLKRRP